MQALILAAGRGSRLRELTDDRPKCLVPLAGKPLLRWQYDVLRAAGARQVLVVRGYLAERLVPEAAGLPPGAFATVDNPRWAQCNMLASLLCAGPWLDATFAGGETEVVDTLFLEMWAKAREVHDVSGGAFDVTVAPLVNAWGFGTEGKQMPEPGEVDSLLSIVGMDKVVQEGDRLVKTVPGVQIDASSIAKGLGVDLVAEFFDRHGVANYMIEIGGEIRVRGKSAKDRPWRIGIDKPVDDSTALSRQLQTILELTGGSLATSGNYRRYYVVDGKKYAHTIDPKTGRPVQRDIVGASVYAPTCMEADAYATAFMVLGMEEARRVVRELPAVEACLIYVTPEGKMDVWMSEGIRKLVLEE